MTDAKVAFIDPVAEFLHYLYDGLEGYAYAPILNRETKKFHKRFFQVPTELNSMVEWINTRTKTEDVFVAPAIFKSESAERINFKASNVVWTEFDGNTPDRDNLGDIPKPSLRIQSSAPGHEHWYWKLENPVIEVSILEGINRSITYTLSADASSWDASQILRPPATTNHKRGTTVSLSESNSERFAVASFADLTTIPEPQPTFALSNIPDASAVVLAYAFSEAAISLFKTKDFPVGKRSSALMKLGYYLAEMGMSDAEMFSVLRNADDRWKKFVGRTDRDRRLVDLIAAARIKYPSVQNVETDSTLLFGFQSFLDTEIEVEWLIPGILQSQGYMLLTGPANVGKTQFSLRWAINLALGKQFLKHEITRKLRILFMSLEMGHADLKYFVSSMATELSPEERIVLEQNLLFAPLGEPFYIDNPEGQTNFEAILASTKPDIFMWDSLGSATGAQLSDEITVKKIMDFNDRLRKKYSVASWFIHHNRKATADNKKPTKLSDVYGNQYIVNRATSVYMLHPITNYIEVIPLKKRLAKLEAPWAIERVDSTLDFVRKTTVLKSEASVLDDANRELTDRELNRPSGEGLEM